MKRNCLSLDKLLEKDIDKANLPTLKMSKVNHY